MFQSDNPTSQISLIFEQEKASWTLRAVISYTFSLSRVVAKGFTDYNFGYSNPSGRLGQPPLAALVRRIEADASGPLW